MPNRLTDEFPECTAQIHTLKMSDAHFARLYEEYEDVCKQLLRIEQEIDKVSNILEEKFKKQRLFLKDQITSMLKQAA